MTNPCDQVRPVIPLLNPTPDGERNEFSLPSPSCRARPHSPESAVPIRPQSSLCSHYLCQWSPPASAWAHREPTDVSWWTRKIIFIWVSCQHLKVRRFYILKKKSVFPTSLENQGPHKANWEMTAHCGILELSISSQDPLSPLYSLILPAWTFQVLSLQSLSHAHSVKWIDSELFFFFWWSTASQGRTEWGMWTHFATVDKWIAVSFTHKKRNCKKLAL